tara:strand:- start:749 stop:1981 length:1233 start_codon:yes stop_codon:yes gene_type:complete
MYFLYNFTLLIILILSPIIIFYRILIGKENPHRFKEKFCFFSKKPKKGKTLWFHGASVGEIKTIIPLIIEFEKRQNVKQILVTSNTLSSSHIISKYKLKKTIHQFFPIDINFFVKKFLNYWNPHLSIFVDSEIWPNMIRQLYNKKTPIILLNARITNKSYKKWITFPNSSKEIFNKITMSIPQNLETSKYLKILGVKNINKVANLKYYGQKDTHFNKNLDKKFANRIIWCAASTHEGEEKIIASIHKKIKLNKKKLITVLIPRHINRKKTIINDLEKMNLNVVTHSSNNKINKNSDIYLVDVYGEASIFYKLSNLVFMGGSLIPHGGQNPLEPARLGNYVIHGPHIKNFKEVYKFLNKLKFSSIVKNKAEMAKIINKRLNLKKQNLTTNKLYLKGKKILKNIIKDLDKYL